MSKVEKAPEVEGWGKEIAGYHRRVRASRSRSRSLALRLARDRAWDDWEKNRIESGISRRQAQTLTADDLLDVRRADASRRHPGKRIPRT